MIRLLTRRVTYKHRMYDEYMAEKTSAVNISFRRDLLNQIDEVARLYIERERRMDAALE